MRPFMKSVTQKCCRARLCRDAGGQAPLSPPPLSPAKAFTVNGPGAHVRIGHHWRHYNCYARGGGCEA